MLQIIQLDRLWERIEADARGWQVAEPFPHIVVDDFLRPGLEERLLHAFPGQEWDGWIHNQRNQDEWQPLKLQCHDEAHVPEPLDRLIFELNSGACLKWLEALTGIPHLLPDPHLAGGGLHSSGPGGRLAPHTDFHFGAHPRLHRRINLLLYLNQDWQPENQGALELWDQRQDCIAREIQPEFGRTVIFQTDADSMHGFSKPIVDRFRNSIALYYYTVAAPSGYSGDAATHWRKGDDFPTRRKRSLVRNAFRRVCLFGARSLGWTAWKLTRLSHRIEELAGRAPR